MHFPQNVSFAVDLTDETNAVHCLNVCCCATVQLLDIFQCCCGCRATFVYTVSQKNAHIRQNKPILIIFGVLNFEGT